MNVDGTNDHTLISAYSDYYPPMWSPNGKYVAFGNGVHEVCVVDIANDVEGCPLILQFSLLNTVIDTHAKACVWSPDSTAVACYISESSFEGERDELWIATLNDQPHVIDNDVSAGSMFWIP
jgi:hypothetical protein